MSIFKIIIVKCGGKLKDGEANFFLYPPVLALLDSWRWWRRLSKSYNTLPTLRGINVAIKCIVNISLTLFILLSL